MENQEIELSVDATAQAIEHAAATALELSRTLERMAASMREKKDLTYASEAAAAIAGSIPSFRMELLVSRPMREYQLQFRV